MKIKHLIRNHKYDLIEHHSSQMLPSHKRALDAILACRSHCGEFYSTCSSCSEREVLPLSCGHRSCPQCQHNLGDKWLQQQQEKLLPATYYLVTFTVPKELRETIWQHQGILYEVIIKAAVEAMQTVARNNFGIKLGMTAVLHTHKRDKGYHPHVHIIVPGGGIPIKPSEKNWKALPQNYIVNEVALAQVFRGIFFRMLFEQAMELPSNLPKQWVCHILNAGQGKNALEYLSRYLYRGVVSENDILTNSKGQVTFQYQDSKTKSMKVKTQPAHEFLWALLKHVLPRRFRRVRDYGFLHGNAKKTLDKIKSELNVKKAKMKAHINKPFRCKLCSSPMRIELVIPRKIPMMIPWSSYVRPALE